jgi:hypothetical protein
MIPLSRSRHINVSAADAGGCTCSMRARTRRQNENLTPFQPGCEICFPFFATDRVPDRGARVHRDSNERAEFPYGEAASYGDQ